jgi:hypothetical protein
MAGANLTGVGILGDALNGFMQGRSQAYQRQYQMAQFQMAMNYKNSLAQAAMERAGYYGQHVTDQGQNYQNTYNTAQGNLGLRSNEAVGDGRIPASPPPADPNAQQAYQPAPMPPGPQMMGGNYTPPTSAPMIGMGNPSMPPIPGGGPAPDPSATGAGPSPAAAPTDPLAGLGPRARAKILNDTQRTKTASDLAAARTNHYGTQDADATITKVGGLSPEMQAAYLNSLPNNKLPVPDQTVIGSSPQNFSSPISGYDNTPFNQVAAATGNYDGDFYQPAYTPDLKTQSGLDKANSQIAVNGARLPLLANQARLTGVRADDQSNMDNSLMSLRGAQGKFFGSHAANLDTATQLMPGKTAAEEAYQAAMAGAATQNANTRQQTAGGVNGDDKFGLALNVKKAALAASIAKGRLPTMDSIDGTTVVKPALSQADPKAFAGIQNSYNAVNQQLYQHMQQRNSPQGAPLPNGLQPLPVGRVNIQSLLPRKGGPYAPPLPPGAAGDAVRMNNLASGGGRSAAPPTGKLSTGLKYNIR